jgi:hypothetical protein
LAALLPGYSPRYQLDRRPGGSQSRSGRGVEDKISHPLPGLLIYNIQRWKNKKGRESGMKELGYNITITETVRETV